VKKPYHIVTRAASESAAVIEQFCQSSGQILLPIVNLIQSASAGWPFGLAARSWRARAAAARGPPVKACGCSGWGSPARTAAGHTARPPVSTAAISSGHPLDRTLIA